MNQGLIPRRYAKALYKFALEHGNDTVIYKLMNTLVESFVANPDLQTVMSNPFVGDADKRKLLMTAAGAKESDKDFADFLKLLVDNNRIDMIQSIALAYRDLYRQEHHIYEVSVTSAAPLDAEEEQRLKSMIAARLFGGSMEYKASVDPDLIGGFVIRINNERLDASVENELRQMRIKLLSK